MDTISYVVGFVLETSVRFAPVFFLSIALAALVKSLPIAAVASRWLARREHASVVGGSLLGAFSPFCSCTVIPVVRSLLVAGAPLAGVMAFWVASPLMDPEIFLFTVGLLGWDLAIARLVAAVALSLLAGAGALVAVRRGWLPAGLAEPVAAPVAAARALPMAVGVGANVGGVATLPARPESAGTTDACCEPAPTASDCCDADLEQPTALTLADDCCDVEPECCAAPTAEAGRGVVGTLRSLDWSRVRADFLAESWTIGRWLLVAFAIEALILRYVPQEALVQVLGSDAPWAVPLAALLGVPLYLDNLSALPIIAGLLEQGMAPGAAIAFLLAGPVTTIPAMTAVRAVLPGPVFRYYLGVSVLGSMTVGAVAGLLL